MGLNIGDAAATVRATWLALAVTKLQVAVGTIVFADRQDSEAAMDALANGLTPPISRAEVLALRGLLLEFACRWGARAHMHAHGDTPAVCGFDSATLLVKCWSAPAEDPTAAFRTWIHAFHAELSRHHPLSVANRAARMIRRQGDHALTIATMARQLSVSPDQLRQHFRHEFGVSIPAYTRTVRVASALQLLTTGKVEAVMLAVGYRSKKNFYRSFRQLTGLTPAAVRRLSPEAVGVLIDAVWSPTNRHSQKTRICAAAQRTAG